MKRERILTMLVVLAAVLCAFATASSATTFEPEHFAGAFAHPHPQTSSAPVPIAPPPDVLGPQATAGNALMSLLTWGETAIQSHDNSIQLLWGRSVSQEAAIAAIPAGPAGANGAPGPMGATGPQGMPGLPGQPLNAPQVDTTNITASSPAVNLVRSLCYPSQPFAGNIPTTGESIDFTFTTPATGTYTLQACVASLGGAHTYHAEFPIGTKIGGSLTVLNTASYQVFAYQSVGNVTLPAGQVTVRFVMENGGMNLAGFNYR